MKRMLAIVFGIGTLALLGVVLFSSARATAAPLYYEHHSTLSLPSSPVAANPYGEYFVLRRGTCNLVDPIYLTRFDNDLNETGRIYFCPGDMSPYFNDIATDNQGNIWITEGRFSRYKRFIKLDPHGNFLLTLNVDIPSGTLVANYGFTFDGEGYLYFIGRYYNPYWSPPSANELYKVDPATGVIVRKWTVPVGGPHGWAWGMATNSKGEIVWGEAEGLAIRKFDPLTEQVEVFAVLPNRRGMSSFIFAMDSEDTLYVTQDPYWGRSVFVFDSMGNYIGEKVAACGSYFYTGIYGLAAFMDEVVVTGHRRGFVIKYTSDAANSREYICWGDAIPPTTGISFQGVPGLNDWYVSDVLATLTAVDNEGGSGVKETGYSFDGTSWYTYVAPFPMTTEGTSTVYYMSTDNAENAETAKDSSVKIDKTPPLIIIGGVADGAEYALGLVPEAGYEAWDDTSGLSYETASLTGGDPYGLGTFTYTVTAYDYAGHERTASVTYSVIGRVDGLNALVDQYAASGDIKDAGLVGKLHDYLDDAQRYIDLYENDKAIQSLEQFKHDVDQGRDKGDITPEAGTVLLHAADDAISRL